MDKLKIFVGQVKTKNKYHSEQTERKRDQPLWSFSISMVFSVLVSTLPALKGNLKVSIA